MDFFFFKFPSDFFPPQMCQSTSKMENDTKTISENDILPSSMKNDRNDDDDKHNHRCSSPSYSGVETWL